MGIENVIRQTITEHDSDHTAAAGDLGTRIADALQGIGVYVGDEVADYIRDLGDRTEMPTTEVVNRLAEAIEEDRDEEVG